MKALSLMFHDVVEDGRCDESGFPGPGARVYKLDRQAFAWHLEALRSGLGSNRGAHEYNVVFLTFDDGGASGYDPIAQMLEEFRWRGHFFVATDWIDRPGFLSTHQIRDLDHRGHVIGSHSCSHPTRMSQISWDQLLYEWRASVERLAKIVGHQITLASVPGGYYSRKVAQAAAVAGIRTLFTSEPTARVHVVDGCRVLGRYAVQRGMGPQWSADLAAGKIGPRVRQALLWQAKRAAKAVGGGAYPRLREAFLRQLGGIETLPPS
jgi:peptidoglycan/xylan/chitin deacetylase (PgdA/CDA1 family)